MLTYGWKQRWRGLLCNAMKNHALQQRRGAGAVPLSPSWQVCSATWQLSISMINAVVPGLPVTKLKSVLLRYFKVKWKSRTTQKDSRCFISHVEILWFAHALMKTLTYLNICDVLKSPVNDKQIQHLNPDTRCWDVNESNYIVALGTIVYQYIIDFDYSIYQTKYTTIIVCHSSFIWNPTGNSRCSFPFPVKQWNVLWGNDSPQLNFFCSLFWRLIQPLSTDSWRSIMIHLQLLTSMSTQHFKGHWRILNHRSHTDIMSICCWEKWFRVSWGLTKYMAAFQITYFSFSLLVCTAAVPIPFHALCIQIGHTLCFELWPSSSYICCCPCLASLSLRLLQPSRQNKCCQCTFLQTWRFFTFPYVPFFYFTLWQYCAWGLLWVKHKNHLVRGHVLA